MNINVKQRKMSIAWEYMICCLMMLNIERWRFADYL